MNKKSFIFYLSVSIFVFGFGCQDKKPEKDTIVTGSTSLLVDESLVPIVEDQLAVFQNSYDATIRVLPQSEKEAVISLTEKKADIAVLSRKLSAAEEAFFKSKSMIPVTTAFAKDGIALVTNTKSNDTLLSVAEIVDFLHQKPSKIKGLVFDNPNSGTVQYICNLAGLTKLPEKNVYSFKTNNEVMRYVAENNGLIGVVGVNWITQPSPDMDEIVSALKVMYLKNTADGKYYQPTQDALAAGTYPLARDLYIINCQGYDGLGIGLASFIAGEKGQRIILKSGLAPVRVPGRNIKTRKEIEISK